MLELPWRVCAHIPKPLHMNRSPISTSASAFAAGGTENAERVPGILVVDPIAA